MARALGISTRTLARRESGEDAMTPGEIALAIQATGVPKAFMDSGWAALSGSDSVDDRLAELEATVRQRIPRQDALGETVAALAEELAQIRQELRARQTGD